MRTDPTAALLSASCPSTVGCTNATGYPRASGWAWSLQRGLAALLTAGALFAAGCAEDTATPKPGDTEEPDTGGAEIVIDNTDIVVGSDAQPDSASDKCTTDQECAGKVTIAAGSCQAAVCNKASGKCEATGKAADGTSCDDGKECTTADKCSAGTCGGTVDCVDPGTNPICRPGTCDAGGKCQFTTANGKACDDGNACLEDDKCIAGGKCVGSTQVKCDDGDPCTQDLCDKDNGGCKSTKLPADTACEDGDKCTTNGKCDAAGACKSEPVVCGGTGKPCQIDFCDQIKGCTTKAAENNEPCSDGSSCTEGDICSSGACVGKSVADVDDKNPCTEDVCDGKAAKPTISHNTGPKDGVACDDGAPCTKQDTCVIGACIGTKLVCNDQNPCTDDVCDPNKCDTGDKNCGQCVAPQVNDGTVCSDGKDCTGSDKCAAGKCTGIDLISTGGCDDNNACTNDGCLQGSGCINTPTAPGTTKFCNDGNSCTELDKCGGSTCSGVPRDCNDNLPCTADSCDAAATDPTKACKHEAFTGPCDDKDACTGSDVCLDNTCAGEPINCDDGNPCTADFCDTVKGCQHQSAAGGSPCDDGVSCTTGDYCDSGVCKFLSDTCVACNTDTNCLGQDDGNLCNGAVKCLTVGGDKGKVCAIDKATIVTCDTSSDTACSITSCNPDSGACVADIKQEGISCTSPDKCVANATCDAAGVCKGTAKDCNDGESCTTDSCDSAKGCVHTALTDNAVCSDGNDCTPNSQDRCKTGKCSNTENTCTCTTDSDCDVQEAKDGNLCNDKFACETSSAGKFCVLKVNTPTVCTASTDPCQTAACTPGTGVCENSPKITGASCDDNNVCTLQTTCDAQGGCKGGNPLQCNDNQPCTTDVCDKILGCFFSENVPGQICNDNNVCTSGDTCKSGICSGVSLQCDDNNPCTIDTCNKLSGCSYLIDDTLSCNDGDPCTTPDTCNGVGVCVGTVLNCDDNNPCTVDLCNNNGGCKNTQVDGKDCSDGDDCTVQDSCQLGLCKGKAVNCDDNNPCTTDSCSDGECTLKVTLNAPCNDDNECTTTDKCNSGGACVGQTIVCDTSNTCLTALGCLPTKGCQTASNDGIVCNDNDNCTLGDKCSGGGCQGSARDCDDENVCTTDSCDPKKADGCVITANTCDDNNDCTIDSCDQVTGCAHEAVDGKACEDGDACTEGGKCVGAVCSSKAVSCDDNSPCTTDSCDPNQGCLYQAVPDDTEGLTCTDDDPCTDTSCVAGVCEPTPKVCDDGNPCTVDSCNEVKGCITADAAEAQPCDDDDSCTKDTQCQGGSCTGGVVDGVGCGICATDNDCKIFDNNDQCDGRFSCKPSKTGLKLCYFEADPIVCDSTLDSACNKNTCDPQNGTCAMTEQLNGTKCEDGLGCTANDFCLNGGCKAGPTTDCSGAADSCNLAQCAEDSAATLGYRCEKVAKAGAVACDADGDGCTANDFCQAGTCTKGEQVDCTGVAKDCESATCKSTSVSTFQCEVKAQADGAACEDGQLCTTGDNCIAGQCKSGSGAFDCSSTTGTCAVGICDPAGNGGTGACQPQPRNEGQTCNADSNACTVGDKCVAGACVPGAPPDCTTLSGACTVGACKSLDNSSFQCIGAPKVDNLPCEADQNGCTVGDSCKAGKCEPGKVLDCSGDTSADGCQVGTCVPISASQGDCQPLPALAGKPCNSDNNGCTKGDTCNGEGACQPGAAVDCIAFSGACSTGVCQSTGSQTFSCAGNSEADGTACDADQDGCTANDKCAAGLCVKGTAVACDASGATDCLQPLCFGTGSNTYQCDLESKEEGLACNADSNGCTKNDGCIGGFCTPGVTEFCDISNDCALSSCQSTGNNAYQCLVTPLESYPPLSPDVACATDGSVTCPTGYSCNAAEGVIEGLCQPNAIVSCDDGNICTEGDACNNGTCSGGKQKDCDDFDSCTADSCNAGVCSNTAIAGCSICIDEALEFEKNEGTSSKFRTWANVPSYIGFGFTTTSPLTGIGSLFTEWQAPMASPPDNVPKPYASIRLRRLYVEKNQSASLQFLARAEFEAGGCGFDDLEVWVNGALAFQQCEPTKQAQYLAGTTHQRVSVNLAPYSGAALDVEIRVVGGFTAPSSGKVWIDDIKLAGNCTNACVGGPFEATDPSSDLTTLEQIEEEIPQTWSRTSTDSNVVTWAPATGTAHTGQGMLQASWNNSAAAASQLATFTIPSVQTVTGSKLYFAVKAPELGNLACGADDLVVRVNGTEVYKLCAAQTGWTTQAVNLPGGQTVTVTFEVVTGSTTGSKGTVQIDDIGVTGACLWDCFSSKFDGSTGMSAFTTSSSQAANFKPWAASSTTSKSPSFSAFAGHSASPAVIDSRMSQAQSKKVIRFGINTGVLTLSYNLFVGTPSACATDQPFVIRGLINNSAATVSTQLDTDGNLNLYAGCPVTSGWANLGLELPVTMVGESALSFAAIKIPGNSELKLYIDDVIVMCR